MNLQTMYNKSCFSSRGKRPNQLLKLLLVSPDGDGGIASDTIPIRVVKHVYELLNMDLIPLQPDKQVGQVNDKIMIDAIADLIKLCPAIVLHHRLPRKVVNQCSNFG